MMLKKPFIFIFAAMLMISVLTVTTFAADDPVLKYEVLVDGVDLKEAEVGDIVTVTLYLQRTDKEEPYTMYAMQSELRYDSTFFELVKDSANLNSGVNSTDIDVGDGFREFYMNFVSLTGGIQWQPRTRVGSFQLKVIGTNGVSTITNEDYMVSAPIATGGYKCESNSVSVVLTTECVIKFQSNGGAKIDPVTAIFGEKLTPPESPVRDGKDFAGWYKDVQLTEKWDFETDTVQSSMTLYAKWVDTPVNPTPGGDPVNPTPGGDPVNPTPGGEPVDPDPGNDPVDPTPGDDPIDPTPPDEPDKPGDHEKQHCVICGRENTVFGLPLCGLCLLILMLILLVAVLIICVIFRKKSNDKK